MHNKLLALAVGALGLLTLGPAACAERLPHLAMPDHYDLTFQPSFTHDNFAGVETIDIHVLEPTSKIVLNSAEITFGEAEVTSGGQTQRAQVTTDAKAEMATFKLPKAIPAGPATVRVKFTGILNNELRGFYLSKANGRKYATTQFEATDARRAFPCFDEPAYKSTFSITLIVDRDDTAISNGAVISDRPGPGPGKHTVQFATSPKMSSYLVAMAVGDFECLKGSSDGVPIRTCATPDRVKSTSFALEAAEYVLHYYDQYFGIKYPFHKLDLVGIPDFAAGAMENTAAIFFRETDLLIGRQSSANARRGVAGVVAHEMAHQWFGDLVTMAWWNDIWLNEGFATWMSSKPVAAWKPQWNVKIDRAAGTDGSLNLDSYPATRPIRQQAETPAQISALFDGIAYGKTAAVLRMVESYVGEQEFRAGVNHYLTLHAYSNATAGDFWNAVTQVSRKPVNRIMPTFVDQPGAPIVNVEASCGGGATALRLSQRRFSYDRALFDAGSPEVWQVPVCVKGAGLAPPTQCILLAAKQQSYKLHGCGSWLFADAGARGYYRMGYSAGAARKLASIAEHDLAPGERIALAGNTWAMVRIGKQKIGDYMDLAAALAGDSERPVMDAAIRRLVYIHTYLLNDSDKPRFEAWVRRLLAPRAKELGWAPKPGESDDRRNLRAAVINTVGEAGRDPAILSEAKSLAEKYLRNPSAVDPSLVNVVLGLAAQTGGASLYDQYLARAKSAKSLEEHYRYFYALASFPEPALLKRTLDYSLSPEVRSQDFAGLIFAAAGNPAGRDLAWQFVKEHWQHIAKEMPPFAQTALVGLGASFCDVHAAEEVRSFFTQHRVPGAQRNLNLVTENIRFCATLKAAQEANLASWLNAESAAAAGK